MNVTVVVPTYNEAGNIRALVNAILGLPLPDVRLVVVDDASPDGTGQLADELAAASSGRVDVLHRTGKRGLGVAYLDGFRWALDHGAEAVVQMDADFSHAPADVTRLVEKLAEFDVAVGSRYVPGGRIDDRWGFDRFALSWSANSYARTILRLKARDATSGFKAWRRRSLEAIDLARIRSSGFLFTVEMAYVSQRLGLRVCEVPIYFADRRVGRSKMSLKVKLAAAVGLIDVWRRHRRIRRSS